MLHVSKWPQPSFSTLQVFGGLCMFWVRRRVRLNKQFERSIAPDEIKGLEITLMYSRVPSKRVAMVSRKVFCGAFRPLITGIRERVEPRLSRRSEPWLSAAGVTKPGRNLQVPGAPPNPWRRAPSRDARDSTVQHWPRTTAQVIPAIRRREDGGMERRERGTTARMVTFTHGCTAKPFLSLSLAHSLSLSTYPQMTFLSLSLFLFFLQCALPPLSLLRFEPIS